MTTIANLWNGNLAPVKDYERNDPAIRKLVGLIDKNEDDLERLLDEKQKKVFEKYVCCIDEYLNLTTEQAFCEGFSLCSKILTEALQRNTDAVQ